MSRYRGGTRPPPMFRVPVLARSSDRLDASLFFCLLLTFTFLLLSNSLVFDSPRGPLGSSRTDVKVPIRVLLHGICNNGAIFHKLAEYLEIPGRVKTIQETSVRIRLECREKELCSECWTEGYLH